MQQFSRVPSIIKQRGIKFYNENSVEVIISSSKNISPSESFEEPYLKIDTFSRKSLKEIKITLLRTIDELKKLGYDLISISAKGRAWHIKQKVIYMLNNKLNPFPRAKKFDYIPRIVRIEYDTPNRRVRVAGESAGYRHYPGAYGGHGPWMPVLTGNKTTENKNGRIFGFI